VIAYIPNCGTYAPPAAAQVFISTAGFRQKLGPRILVHFPRRVVNPLDLLPAFIHLVDSW
jgi:hypothetical protein